jgi:hypothetical protein
MDLHTFVCLAKNLRAVLYLPEMDENFVRLVARYHRYRGVGVPEGMEPPHGRPFVPLSPPPGCGEFYATLGPAERALLLSSAYIAPVLTLPQYLEHFEVYEIFPIMADAPLNIREGLRHLRMSEYAMIDVHASAGCDEDALRRFAEEDVRKRFWRVRGDAVRAGSYCHLRLPEDVRAVTGCLSIVLAFSPEG